jgi:hypothetical protein
MCCWRDWGWTVDRDDGGPAFPTNLSDDGMSLLDYFAAKAMQAMLNNDIRREEMATVANVARDAYRMAEAMLAERSKP